MKLLLDTHVLLWSIDSPNLLSERARSAILDEKNELFASVASIWEITIKVQAGKLGLRMTLRQLPRQLALIGVSSFLPIGLFDVQELEELPRIHQDPFDRLFVAQAKAGGMTVVTKDPLIHRYAVPVIW